MFPVVKPQVRIKVKPMKASRNLILLWLLCALVLPAVSQGQFTYTTNSDGSLNLYQYAGGGAVTIPDTTNGIPVTSIGDQAFFGRTSVTSVAIGTNVNSIGNFAFDNCLNLTSITIPNSVTSIGNWAFENCSILNNVTIPNGVTSIEVQTFYNCLSLTSVTIGSSVTNILYEAFYGCVNLTSVYFQGNAPSFGSSVFPLNIATVYYLPGTTGWGPTFDGLPTFLLSSPYICTPTNGTITISGYTGSGSSITIPSMINGLLVTSIGSGAFYNCTSLTNVTIPNSVTSIGGSAFENCYYLANMIIPNSVANIGDYAFSDCYSLKGIYFQGNAPSVNSYSLAFEGDNNLKAYYLPGTTGWAVFSADTNVKTALWTLPYPTILSFEPNFGVQTNSFGFTISWATNISFVVETCTDLVQAAWSPASTNKLTSGTNYFSDSQWTNYPGRFYRLRSP